MAPNKLLRHAAGPASVWDGKWHHVAGTFDGSTVRLYVDGVQVGTGTPAPDHDRLHPRRRRRPDRQLPGHVPRRADPHGRHRRRPGLVAGAAGRHDLERAEVARFARALASTAVAHSGRLCGPPRRVSERPRHEGTGSLSCNAAARLSRGESTPSAGLRMKTYVAKPTDRERNWLVVDAEGQTLGRLVDADRRCTARQAQADLHPAHRYGRLRRRRQRGEDLGHR